MSRGGEGGPDQGRECELEREAQPHRQVEAKWVDRCLSQFVPMQRGPGLAAQTPFLGAPEPL